LQVLPWHIAYLAVVVTGNVALALAHAGWSLTAQLVLTFAAPAAIAVASSRVVLRAGRARARA
jgi:hypothetical protein